MALLVSSGVAQICALARYTILARLLGPEQLGLAAILILTAQFFDSVTDSGSDRFLVQDHAGSVPALLRLTHLVSLGRGLLIAEIGRAAGRGRVCQYVEMSGGAVTLK